MKKKIVKIVLGLLGVLVLAFVLVLGYLGFIPGLSALLGANKPRDLGITYTAEDLASAHKKSQIKYGKLDTEPSMAESIVYKGTRKVDTVFTSQEITASMNNQAWKYWPYKDVQVKFNADGSAEISGILLKDKVRGFGEAIAMPSNIVKTALRFLPPDPAFYVKGKASLRDNKVKIFEPQAFQIGRLSLPVGMFLSAAPVLTMPVYAAETEDIAAELDKVDNKREWIISYINGRLTAIEGFNAQEAKFGDNELIYNGTLSKEILTVQ